MSAPTHRAPKMITPRKATAVAVVGLSAGTVAMVPSSSQAETLAQAKAQYQSDVSQGEAAGQTYDQQEQAYAQLQQKLDALQGEIATQNQQIASLNSAIGQQAAEQYRSGGVSTSLELALSASPATYLDKVASQNEIASQENKQLKTIASDQAELKQEQALAATLVQQQQAALTKAKAAKVQADNLTTAAKQLVASLTPAEQQQVNIGSSGSMWFHYSGTLPVATGRGAIAVAYAESKLGDDYVYAGNGPTVFDCSGLTQEAWKAAGVDIPRTSYDQYSSLPHISRSQLQPGDLVYFFGVPPSHVAIYIGNGMYIQATHPGSYVEWASLDPSSPYYGNMPVTGYTSVG
ncbi:C40 family peptidase [Actinospica sp.]|jgi:cell wall-associated NlpC family hydrolase|uniref:C40 family peptidase n=1 Tax=Actinospica sp. TaxID=1872142 RepID=UPI002C5202DE|nr:NlpC/P60 family protein [Actinospica sp.]HWG27811.1 NlpC/P60 family protein [Actinospica sp.]